MFYQKQRRLEESIALWKKVLELRPDDQMAHSTWAWSSCWPAGATKPSNWN